MAFLNSSSSLKVWMCSRILSSFWLPNSHSLAWYLILESLLTMVSVGSFSPCWMSTGHGVRFSWVKMVIQLSFYLLKSLPSATGAGLAKYLASFLLLALRRSLVRWPCLWSFQSQNIRLLSLNRSATLYTLQISSWFWGIQNSWIFNTFALASTLILWGYASCWSLSPILIFRCFLRFARNFSFAVFLK